MKSKYYSIVILLFLLVAGIPSQVFAQSQKKKYQPTFESLEKVNPVPEWFKDAKFGIYFHWGVYSVPAYSNEWYPRTMYVNGSAENKNHIRKYGNINEWPYNNFITGEKDKQGNFVQFAPKLKSEGGKLDPDEWAQLFADAGARFVGPVAEHHDGFSMWASKVNPWNAKDMGPKLDLVGLFTDAFRKKNMKIMLSMHHAYNITGYYEYVPKTDDPKLQMLFGQQGKEKNEALWLAKHKEIIDNYKPDIIYQDFNLHIISQSVLLNFLSYYYNRAEEWNKNVVATFKDGLNKNCAVLDYERGGPQDLTENYWLTDDAISSSSWCYTEGIGYYSKIQVLHAFLDRISKNGNMVLNISPMADGTIPQEQKDVLLAMGSWLKKYGEAVYSTRAWVKYGEGPTKMGASHGVMGAPVAGTTGDIRYTRTKDNSTLFAILLGLDKDQKKIKLASLSSERIDCKNLLSAEIINGEAGKYLPLNFKQTNKGLIVDLPKLSFDDMAYVLKLKFKDAIPTLNKFADINCKPNYYLIPGENAGSLVLGSSMKITGNRQDLLNQWKLESLGKGYYKILNRRNTKLALTLDDKANEIVLSSFSGKENQIWKIDEAPNATLKISSKKLTYATLSFVNPVKEDNVAGLLTGENNKNVGWRLAEVCETKREPFKKLTIPGTIEAEDYDKGCPGDTYFDSDEVNQGGSYRNDGVDIEKRSAGTYNVGWTKKDEFLTYTVHVKETGMYDVTFNVASPYDSGKIHLESDDKDLTGEITIPNSAGFQNWTTVKKSVKMSSGKHLLKLVVDGELFNIDKIVFEKAK